ncbi:hypothetical protein QBC34DRAFT_468759 [Podospora aff. communis PSN243]|uniref:RING-type domain-containing protein n=1 Tax=Podospora aff. communis PSN243 TaxID=3040156 RepID=A0AAV9GFQ2_9PEZI|nr:hypothetical protein QBC34DRAFT_468759 [Podospora aff. communis PSN243]
MSNNPPQTAGANDPAPANNAIEEITVWHQLRIVGCYTPVDTDLFLEETQGFVLACGHMFCEVCWLQMHREVEAAARNDNYKCPLCAGNRDCIIFPKFGCYIMALQIPTRSDVDTPADVKRMLRDTSGRREEGVPLTFPELLLRGITPPQMCLPCYEEDVFGLPQLLDYVAQNPRSRAAHGFAEMASRFHELFMEQWDVTEGHWRCPPNSGYCRAVDAGRRRPRQPVGIPVPNCGEWYWDVWAREHPAPGEPMGFEVDLYAGPDGEKLGNTAVISIPLHFWDPNQ